jgi:hypothetical protein
MTIEPSKIDVQLVTRTRIEPRPAGGHPDRFEGLAA